MTKATGEEQMKRWNSNQGLIAVTAFILSHSGILMATPLSEYFVWDSPIQLVYDFSDDLRSGFVMPENDDSNDVIALADHSEVRLNAASKEDLSQAARVADYIKFLVAY